MPVNAFNDVYQEMVFYYRKIQQGAVNELVYYPVCLKIGAIEYEIFNIYIFNKEIDVEDNFIKLSSQKFSGNKASFLNYVMFTLSGFILEFDNQPRYVVEPGKDAINFLLAKLNIQSKKTLITVLLNGQMPGLLGCDPKYLKEYKKLKRKIKTLEVKANNASNANTEDLMEEIENLKIEKATLAAEKKDLESTQAFLADKLKSKESQLIEALKRDTNSLEKY